MPLPISLTVHTVIVSAIEKCTYYTVYTIMLNCQGQSGGLLAAYALVVLLCECSLPDLN